MVEVNPLELEPTVDLKTEILQTRVTEQEKDFMVEEAKRLRISLSAFNRMMLLFWKGEIKHP